MPEEIPSPSFAVRHLSKRAVIILLAIVAAGAVVAAESARRPAAPAPTPDVLSLPLELDAEPPAAALQAEADDGSDSPGMAESGYLGELPAAHR